MQELPIDATSVLVLALEPGRALVRYYRHGWRKPINNWIDCAGVHGDACPGDHVGEDSDWRHKARVPSLSAEQASDLIDRVAQRAYSGGPLRGDPISREQFRERIRRHGCPQCGAQPGERCIGAAGQYRVSNHQARIDAAQ